MNISKASSLTTPSNALQRQVSTTHTFELKPSHKNEATPGHKANNLAQALQEFYHIHQRSQITGVPTSEYNQAVQALGLNPDDAKIAKRTPTFILPFLLKQLKGHLLKGHPL